MIRVLHFSHPLPNISKDIHIMVFKHLNKFLFLLQLSSKFIRMLDWILKWWFFGHLIHTRLLLITPVIISQQGHFLSHSQHLQIVRWLIGLNPVHAWRILTKAITEIHGLFRWSKSWFFFPFLWSNSRLLLAWWRELGFKIRVHHNYIIYESFYILCHILLTLSSQTNSKIIKNHMI